MSDQVWESGDVGGFQCYIVADEDQGTEAAEVYQAKSTEEEDQLLSITPGKPSHPLRTPYQDLYTY